MPNYTVHIYAVVRVPVTIEAESMEVAIAKSDPAIDLYETFKSNAFEYAGEVTGYVVDDEDDIAVNGYNEHNSHSFDELGIPNDIR